MLSHKRATGNQMKILPRFFLSSRTKAFVFRWNVFLRDDSENQMYCLRIQHVVTLSWEALLLSAALCFGSWIFFQHSSSQFSSACEKVVVFLLWQCSRVCGTNAADFFCPQKSPFPAHTCQFAASSQPGRRNILSMSVHLGRCVVTLTMIFFHHLNQMFLWGIMKGRGDSKSDTLHG